MVITKTFLCRHRNANVWKVVDCNLETLEKIFQLLFFFREDVKINQLLFLGRSRKKQSSLNDLENIRDDLKRAININISLVCMLRSISLSK